MLCSDLVYLLETETVAEIRKSILSSVLINSGLMLKSLIKHCRDVDLSCRAVALETLAKAVAIKALSPQQRVDILTISFRCINKGEHYALLHSSTPLILRFQNDLFPLRYPSESGSEAEPEPYLGPMELAVKNLLNCWLSQVGGGIRDLVAVIDPICNTQICRDVLKTIYKFLPSPKQAVDSFDILDNK